MPEAIDRPRLATDIDPCAAADVPHAPPVAFAEHERGAPDKGLFVSPVENWRSRKADERTGAAMAESKAGEQRVWDFPLQLIAEVEQPVFGAHFKDRAGIDAIVVERTGRANAEDRFPCGGDYPDWVGQIEVDVADPTNHSVVGMGHVE